MKHGVFSSWITCILAPVFVVGVLIGPAKAIDLETAVWYYERNQWVPAFLDFQILAAEGNPAAAAYMGRMFRRGWGVEQNFEEAEKWLRAGADGGISMAHHQLGWMYSRGEIDGKRDNINAVKHWKAAAELGYPNAQLDLGVMYWRGEGVPQDSVLAYTWLFIASQNEETAAAKSNLDSLAETMSEEEIVQAKSLAQQLSAEIKSKS